MSDPYRTPATPHLSCAHSWQPLLVVGERKPTSEACVRCGSRRSIATFSDPSVACSIDEAAGTVTLTTPLGVVDFGEADPSVRVEILRSSGAPLGDLSSPVGTSGRPLTMRDVEAFRDAAAKAGTITEDDWERVMLGGRPPFPGGRY